MIVGEVLLSWRRGDDRRSRRRDAARRGGSVDEHVELPGAAVDDGSARRDRRPSVVIVPRTGPTSDTTTGIALDSSAAGADDTTVRLERRDEWFGADTIADGEPLDGSTSRAEPADVDAVDASITALSTESAPTPTVDRDQLTLFDVGDLVPPADMVTEQVDVIDLTADIDPDELTAGHVTIRSTVTVDSRIDSPSVDPGEFPRLPLRPFEARALAERERLAAIDAETIARDHEERTGGPDRPPRVPKWDRPRPPHDWRWYVGILGRTLTATGLLLFAFVAYQLYGTAIENAASQRALEDEFAERLSSLSAATDPLDDVPAPTVADPDPVATEPETADDAGTDVDVDPDPEVDPEVDAGTDEPAGASNSDNDGAPESDGPTPASSDAARALAAATPATDQILPAIDDGAALFQLQIPAIGVDDIVVAGIGNDDLKKGPGHFPDTPMPGQLGNAAIAGHRTTYGQPFHDVDDLEVGDEIVVNTWNGSYIYRVTGQQIVAPSQYEVVATTDLSTASLTLISCHPKFTARERIVITSELVAESSDPVGVPVLDHGRAIGDVAFGTDLPVPDEPLGGGLATEGDAGTTVDESDAVTPTDDEGAAATDETGGDSDTRGDGEGDGDESVGAPAATDDPTDDTSDETSTTDPVSPPAVDPATEAALASLASAETTDAIADAFGDGWFSDPGAYLQILLWGLALIAISIAAYALSRRARRDLVGAVVGVLPFVFALYFFFQNVHRLLPPNL
ncbi:MAG: class E sortase [Actinomycetota bacterium]